MRVTLAHGAGSQQMCRWYKCHGDVWKRKVGGRRGCRCVKASFIYNAIRVLVCLQAGAIVTTQDGKTLYRLTPGRYGGAQKWLF